MSIHKPKIANLPQNPGVYIFKDIKGRVVYVGKATNLKSRVQSYFRTEITDKRFNLETRKGLSEVEPRYVADKKLGVQRKRPIKPACRTGRDTKFRDAGSQQQKRYDHQPTRRTTVVGPPAFARPIEVLIHQVADIAVQETESVLEALILEANLIQKHQPKYNVMGKDGKSFSYFVITNPPAGGEFPRVVIVRETDLAADKKLGVQRERPIKDTKFRNSKTFGPYTSKRQMEIALKIMRKIFPFHALPAKTEKGCLDFQLGRCPGPYVGAISKADYAKNIRGIKMILEGKKKRLLATLEKEMKMAAKKHDFEKAAETRNKLFALKHIRDVALMSGESHNMDRGSWIENKNDARYALRDTRIEAYDISNISGQHAVGSMVVFANDKPDKNQYRKFKIKTIIGADDVGAMREVLLRRFKNDWAQPDLILLDGGKGHLNMAQKLLKDLGLVIPTVAVAKGPSRKNVKIQISNDKSNSNIKNILDNKNLIKQIMDEAHRFAIGYHRKLRSRSLLK